MIVKFLRLLFLMGSGILMLIALSPPVQRWMDRRGFIPDQYSYGDLYNISNLSKFKEKNYVANATLTNADKPVKRYKDVNLYTMGDSFTNIDTSWYAGGHNPHAWVGSEPLVVGKLDTTKKNILVIEFVERILQERMYWPEYKKIYIENGIVPSVKPAASDTAAGPVPNKFTEWLLSGLGHEVNQRLEFILFNGPPFIWLKEAKAELLLNLFGRVPGVVMSANKKHLFYPIEVDTTYRLSAFRPIPDRKLDTLVTNMNTIRHHYLRMGFDEVYVCMIPNKVTILDSTRGSYNHQIERIEANPRLQAPVISMIDTLRHHPNWYHLGDGHWNRNGKRFWVQQVNQLAARWSDHR
ncbi:hypothetical protein [Spirosoma rigui]|uniref:hypothetical protein n=1 Tax=Spirosoma rigui TaxID=564064 RepID=UPI0009B13F2A|nr:hypothetical protein [Spirosoma rigui]